MISIADNLESVRQRIHIAKEAAGSTLPVTLLAVSKQQPASAIREAAAANQKDFGENYLQEACDKMSALEDLNLTWHFIGPLQSNKTRPVAERFAWVHSVDRLKIAQRLSSQRPPTLSPLNICLQVNIDNEASKSGFSSAELLRQVKSIATLPNLRLRGLMCIPSAEGDDQQRRESFAQLRRLRNECQHLVTEDAQLDTLSMGMSGDLDLAIQEGATIVRIGTAIFGARDARPPGN